MSKSTKILLSVLLVAVMLFALAGCSDIKGGKYYLYNYLAATYDDNNYISISFGSATIVSKVGSTETKTKFSIEKTEEKDNGDIVYSLKGKEDKKEKFRFTYSDEGKVIKVIGGLVQYKKK